MHKRETAIERISAGDFDVLVIGGGINGAVATMALAAHGASVAMVDRQDFGSGTSQESSNMVWGGFKYLEHYEIGLVFGLCGSRNKLADAYPSRIAETRFLAALERSSKYPPWFAALGATAYWGLGSFHTRAPRHRSRKAIAALEPTIDTSNVRGGIEYSDYLLLENDSRFVSELAFDSAEHGAAIANYVDVASAERVAGRWEVELVDCVTGTRFSATARTIVNAAGARVGEINAMTDTPTRHHLVLSKGIHLVVPSITDSGRILAFYDDEARLFYVIPMGHRSVIGTTDTRVDDPTVSVTQADRDFVLDQVNKRLSLDSPISAADVIADRCGVRGLVVGDEDVGDRDWTELSRRHAVEVDRRRGVVTVLGGKLTDCLNVGIEVVDAARHCGVTISGHPAKWFGEPDRTERDRFLLRAGHAGLRRPTQREPAGSFADLLWRRYGRRAHEVVAKVEADRSSGASMMTVGDYCRAEIEVSAEEEWIVTMDDFLRRRTRLGQLERPADLRADPGVVEASRILLSEAAAAAWSGEQADLTTKSNP